MVPTLPKLFRPVTRNTFFFIIWPHASENLNILGLMFNTFSGESTWSFFLALNAYELRVPFFVSSEYVILN